MCQIIEGIITQINQLIEDSDCVRLLASSGYDEFAVIDFDVSLEAVVGRVVFEHVHLNNQEHKIHTTTSNTKYSINTRLNSQSLSDFLNTEHFSSHFIENFLSHFITQKFSYLLFSEVLILTI